MPAVCGKKLLEAKNVEKSPTAPLSKDPAGILAAAGNSARATINTSGIARVVDAGDNTSPSATPCDPIARDQLAS
jgi:hypothetical protein